MRHIYSAAATVQRGTNKSLNIQQLETDCSANDIDNRVECSDLVKVHSFNWFVVNMRFRFRQSRKNCHGALFHTVSQLRIRDDLFDIGQGTVVIRINSSCDCGSENHVAAGSCETIEIESSHRY